MSRYTEILTRLREATGPDRQLDDDIIKAVWPDAKVLHYPSYTNFQTIPIQRGGPGSFWRNSLLFEGEPLSRTSPCHLSGDLARLLY